MKWESGVCQGASVTKVLARVEASKKWRLRSHAGAAITISVTLLSGCGDIDDVSIETRQSALIGDSLAGLTAAQAARFADGLDAFDEVETVPDGVGPVFNERGCGNCHNVAASGGGGAQFEVRAGRLVNGVFDSLTAQGGQLFDLFSVTSLPASERTTIPDCALRPNGENVPANANVRAKRRTTPLFGLGFVDATPDSTFRLIAALQSSSVRGRAPLVDNIAAGHKTVGKFGWKDQNPTLHQFAGDAYLNEMGITNPEFPTEQAPQGDPALVGACDGNPVEASGGVEDDGEDVDHFTDFMSMLAAPVPASASVQARVGDVLFGTIGCATCHVRTIISGSSPIAALNNKAYHPFSDFLLHEMGSLGDNIGQNGDARPTEMRTAPLWGIRFLDQTKLLHDGRGASLTDAIQQHDGQARGSRVAFNLLFPSQKAALIAFLNTL
jgi:CxxC motif-containing protein (DUF1111 family)